MSLLSRLAVQAAKGFGALSSSNKVSADYLVVAGGGGGGQGGGGAGGYQASTFTLSTLNTYSVTVGAGGNAGTNQSAGTNGSDSILSGTGISTITSTGGGRGGYFSAVAGASGGSGGGGGGSDAGGGIGAGAAGTSGQGNSGGNGVSINTYNGGGGGGGAGAAGGNAVASSYGGQGGIGIQSSISGTTTYYAGGGSGGCSLTTTGGQGGGGSGGAASANGTAATANTGGGGGGGGNTTGGKLGGAGGSGIVIISYTSATPKFVGGTLTTSGGKQIHTFTSSGTLSPLTPITASYLVVAGGGGGGGCQSADRGGGGGGAGGLLTSSTTLYSGATYVVTVGGGGTAGSASNGGVGSNSVISGTGLTTLTASGGGYGAGLDGATAGGNGGSGGGGRNAGSGGTGTSGQGYAGGTGGGASNGGGGGGGGASALGSAGTGAGAGGNGGTGTASSISGTSTYYAGGGGGGGYTSAGTGGTGGGGDGKNNALTAAVSGTTNTGGGGGGSGVVPPGSSSAVGGAGGSGTVIISYAGSQVFNGGLVTSSGGNTIHTFNATGALTPLTNNLNNSLRFRGTASAYLSRTLSTPTNNKIFTYSAWVKRGALGGNYALFSPASTGTGYTTFRFESDDTINFQEYTGSAYNYQLDTTQVFRDPSAWYHLVVAVDTTQATAANRIKLYVNGNQVTAFATATYPTQNFNPFFNTAVGHNVGANIYSGTREQYFDGYMADINFIDGQALEPYYFGNNDAYGNWKPILYKGTYGTNGFYLTFADTSALTTSSNAGLGKDTSGNGNYWTTNNISITAGSNYDAMIDVPTNTSATVANYCLWNLLDSTLASISGGLREANLTIGNGVDLVIRAARATFQIPSTGKWYWECIWYNTTTTSYMGIGTATTSLSANLGSSSTGYAYNPNGNKYNNGTGTAYGATFTSGDIIGIAFDADNGTLTFYKNNTSQGTAFTGLTSGPYFPMCSVYYGDAWCCTWGQRPFTYTPPSGYVALNTYNLPTPTILQGNLYMDASLYTGDGSSSLTVVNQAQFKPDFVWLKSRSAATDHKLFDSVRGVQKQLTVNTGIETTQTTSLSAFNTNGFTIGALANVNTSAATYVGWNWQAGQGTTTVNTSGATSSNVSVNSTAGFSIVTYTGTGANTTIGHGLSSAPKMFFVKRRNAVDSWVVYHQNLTSAAYILELSNYGGGTESSVPSCFNSTSPNSTVFFVGTNSGTNGSAGTYVSYCWAEIAGFSKFGSYTGNGSTDGPFVYCGFRPKFIMIKSTGTANDWHIFDSARPSYNLTNLVLYADLGDYAEGTGTIYSVMDILSNGFKIRGSNNGVNASGTLIFMAFAENPFKNSNAR